MTFMNDYLTIEDLEEMRDESARRNLLRLYMKGWPSPPQCQVQSKSGRCQNRAIYRLRREDRTPTEVCDHCSHAWIHTFTKFNPVTVVRI